MIGFVIFVVLTFYIPSKLSEMFGGKLKPYGFLRAFVGGVCGATVVFILMIGLNLNFNFLGIIASSKSLDFSKLCIAYAAMLLIGIGAFILDLLFIYGAKFLDWLWEKLSDVFPKKK